VIRLICSVSDLPLHLSGDALDFLGGSLQHFHWKFSPEIFMFQVIYRQLISVEFDAKCRKISFNSLTNVSG